MTALQPSFKTLCLYFIGFEFVHLRQWFRALGLGGILPQGRINRHSKNLDV